MKKYYQGRFTKRPRGDRPSKGKLSTHWDYNEIGDGIFIGSNRCCVLGFLPELRKHHITADISLQDNAIDAPFGAKYFLWLPVRNNASPTQMQFDVGVATLDYFIRNKIHVFLHCKEGHGRAPTLAVAYYIWKGKSVNDALAFVKKGRSVMHLTPVQIRGLRTYAKRVVRQRTEAHRHICEICQKTCR
jgi:hypothetical protein